MYPLVEVGLIGMLMFLYVTQEVILFLPEGFGHPLILLLCNRPVSFVNHCIGQNHI
jgi:hypothetical protein